MNIPLGPSEDILVVRIEDQTGRTGDGAPAVPGSKRANGETTMLAGPGTTGDNAPLRPVHRSGRRSGAASDVVEGSSDPPIGRGAHPAGTLAGRVPRGRDAAVSAASKDPTRAPSGGAWTW